MSQVIDRHAAEQAIAWLIELRGNASPRQQQAWQQWRAADPRHEDAWQRIEQANERLGALPPALLSQALQSVASPARRRALKALGVLLAGLPAGWLAQRQVPLALADYRTGVGERRHWVLAEGSELDLNTDSAANFNQAGQQRTLTLLRGELALQVARATAPMLIDSGLGTLKTEQANLGLRRLDDHCLLQVNSGTVSVRCQRSGAQREVLAGQRLRFDAATLGPIAMADAQGLAWQRGMLIAQRMPLGELATELSRYRHGWLGCDERVAALPVSGSFPLDDQEAILDLLARALPVRVLRRTRFWAQLSPA